MALGKAWRIMDYESILFEVAAATDDFREGVDAFLEKRAPRFRGH